MTLRPAGSRNPLRGHPPRRARVLLRRLLLGGTLLAVPLPADEPPFPAPEAYVTDRAGLLPDESRERVEARLRKLTESHPFVRVYVYLLPGADGRPPGDVTQEFYRRWKMRDRELGDGLATIFVFEKEHEARLFLGQGAPPGFESAVAGVGDDLLAVFREAPEPGLVKVVDRIDRALSGLPKTYQASPPVPAEPEGPVCGSLPYVEADLRALSEAVERASREAGHPIVLVLNPAKGLESPVERMEKLAAAWPDRTLVGVFTNERAALLHPADAVKERFSDADRRRIAAEIGRSLNRPTRARTLTRVVGEIGAISAGRPPAPWVAWKHPFRTLAGGQDADPFPAAVEFGIAAAALVLAALGLNLLLKRRKAVAKN